MKNKFVALLLCVPVLALLAWAGYYVNLVNTAQKVELPIKGFDPRNLLSGHYIRFQIDWDKANCNQADWRGECPKSLFANVNRFYVPEDQAIAIDRAMNSPKVKASIIFAYKQEIRPIAQTLLLNGKPFVSAYSNQ